jgi:hypothetical protein
MAKRASAAPGVMTGKPLIESDRVEGTTVYDPSGNNIGSVRRFLVLASPSPRSYPSAGAGSLRASSVFRSI